MTVVHAGGTSEDVRTSHPPLEVFRHPPRRPGEDRIQPRGGSNIIESPERQSDFSVSHYD